MANRERDVIAVRFSDSTLGKYVFNCLETLYSTKTLLYHLNAKIKELEQIDIETMRQVIKLASAREGRAALELATASYRIKDICVTDTETFYSLKESIRKHLGVSRRG